MSEWQSVETAPEGVEVLLITYAGECFVGARHDGMWLANGGVQMTGFFIPEYWMPLPQPPSCSDHDGAMARIEADWALRESADKVPQKCPTCGQWALAEDFALAGSGR